MRQITVMSKYADSLSDPQRGWSYVVLATDDQLSAVEVQLAELRTQMWGEGCFRGEVIDTLTRGLVANQPGLCTDGVFRALQQAAYPEALGGGDDSPTGSLRGGTGPQPTNAPRARSGTAGHDAPRAASHANPAARWPRCAVSSRPSARGCPGLTMLTRRARSVRVTLPLACSAPHWLKPERFSSVADRSMS